MPQPTHCAVEPIDADEQMSNRELAVGILRLIGDGILGVLREAKHRAHNLRMALT